MSVIQFMQYEYEKDMWFYKVCVCVMATWRVENGDPYFMYIGDYLQISDDLMVISFVLLLYGILFCLCFIQMSCNSEFINLSARFDLCLMVLYINHYY